MAIFLIIFQIVYKFEKDYLADYYENKIAFYFRAVLKGDETIPAVHWFTVVGPYRSRQMPHQALGYLMP